MKRRITKNKLLAKLTKMVDEAHSQRTAAEIAKWKYGILAAGVQYETLIKVRSMINDYRL